MANKHWKIDICNFEKKKQTFETTKNGQKLKQEKRKQK